MVQGVLVHEVGFVDQQDRDGALASELLDVFADGVEDVASGGANRGC